MASENGRNGVRLNRRWDLVSTQADILKHDGVKSSVLELALVRRRPLHGKRHLRSSQGLAVPYSQR